MDFWWYFVTIQVGCPQLIAVCAGCIGVGDPVKLGISAAEQRVTCIDTGAQP